MTDLISGIVAFIFLAWLFSIVADKFNNEVNVYNVICSDTKITLDKCKEKIHTKSTYKVFPQTQTVVELWGQSSPNRFKNCSVWDKRNFICKNENRTVAVSDGDYILQDYKDVDYMQSSSWLGYNAYDIKRRGIFFWIID